MTVGSLHPNPCTVIRRDFVGPIGESEDSLRYGIAYAVTGPVVTTLSELSRYSTW